jgi:DNA-binding transcriptional ArsR family regulator
VARSARNNISRAAVFRALMEARSSPCGLYGLELSRQTGVGPGTLYPLLERLESGGLVEGSWEAGDPESLGRPRRRYYRLTGLGVTEATAVLNEMLNRVAPKGWTLRPGWSQ